MAKEYDVVVLGGGTGGYVAAISAAKNGLSVAVVEKDKLGGTCLHRGCIPSKALLRSAEVFQTVKKAEEFGVTVEGGASLNFLKAQERKAKIVEQLTNGIHQLFKQGKIDLYEGKGTILGPSIFSPTAGTVSVEFNDGSENEMLIPKNLIIATGSRPRSLKGLPLDEKDVFSSDGALQMEDLPKSILIVGGGVIGMEWASMLHDFGVEVTVLEYADRIIPTEDKEISKELTRLFKKKKIKMITSAEVQADTLVKKDGTVSIDAVVKGEKQTFTAEKMLVSVGRSANVENIGLENTDIVVEKGFIQVNDVYQTKESHMFAIGDCIPTLQLAHVAMHEGTIAANFIAGKHVEKLNYDLVPRCIYTSPEIASVGISEDIAKERGHSIKKGKFFFRGIGKALVFGESDGFIKICSDKESEDLLGVSMIGPHVTDMISEAALAQVLDATAFEIGETIHPHPTLSEAFAEAALAVDGNQIHG
ncbi:dihydrolipoamide dehydrogenase [Listeria fleischmannii 1991]|uniref:Dihydrolipoyl dehydrogenase n=2 Tax=Listeria fleischmannii TaxID=1069827 RepID=A0A2X3GLU9_9LIST|nr:dihydrolipoyl dehydrogenase [Listeria fleischmannii]KMT60588.1 dihydrolipoamide dehydrogenase [Listeria fleischmannii 1991]SQC69162.1 Dihydrolipoyl dehydrogenase [Listeria fleischmannii subsp. fleischmannii]